MRKILFTLVLSFLSLSLVYCAYSFDGQSNVNFVIKESPDDIYFVDFSVDFNAPETLPPNITPGDFTVFIWPGLQPNGLEQSCLFPIRTGVLQPVLTYGNSCAPHKPQDTKQWWISGQYVNTNLNCSHVPNGFAPVCDDFFHCHGGDFLTLMPGQEINTSMVYEPATKSWLQTVESGGEIRTYSIALDYCSDNSEPATPVTRDPQAQTNAVLSIETKGYNTPLWQTFENILLKINIGDDQDATCDSTLTINTTVPSSFCSSLEPVSNENGILTCQVESCTICKPTTLDSDCSTTLVPTLSEWGLIAMATVFAIVGFIVLRRRRAAV